MWKPQEFQELDSEAYALQRALESRHKDHEGDIIHCSVFPNVIKCLQLPLKVFQRLSKLFFLRSIPPAYD